MSPLAVENLLWARRFGHDLAREGRLRQGMPYMYIAYQVDTAENGESMIWVEYFLPCQHL